MYVKKRKISLVRHDNLLPQITNTFQCQNKGLNIVSGKM
jgi:hypothetical protein